MAAPDSLPLADPTEVGSLGVYHLKRLWSRAIRARRGRATGDAVEGQRDSLVVHAMGLGLEQTVQYLYKAGPTFEEFEDWIRVTGGAVDPDQVARINAAIAGSGYPAEIQRRLDAVAAAEPVLSPDDLAFWDREGYVVVPHAVAPEVCAAGESLIWDHLGARPDAPEGWYFENSHGIMVQLFQHPVLSAIRRSARIHKAFSQLWGTADLWATTDRVGFNPPERPGYAFPGPHLHWDTSLQQPIPFGTQGILYLTDTPAEQGAFTCVPGFHRRIAEWLGSLPAGADPRRQDLRALGARAVAGRAGDLVIWNQALPHGASPNRGSRPRLVHYVNMYPTQVEEQSVWR
jgi:hypothetical protein